jgi:three-Cys-motif partner protein
LAIKKPLADYISSLYGLFDPSGKFGFPAGKKYLKLLLKNHSQQSNASDTTKYGWWTIEKHLVLHSYLQPFFAIGSKNFRRIVYIDMFAGPGLNLVRNGKDSFPSPGSPLVTYAYKFAPKKDERTERFDSYFFFEKDSSKAQILESRLNQIASDFHYEEKPRVIHNDSSSSIWSVMNEEVKFLSQPKKTNVRPDQGLLFLIFIDPEGLELNWDILSKLIKKYIARDKEDGTNGHYTVADIIYTIPIGGLKRGGKGHFRRTFGIDDIDPARLDPEKIIQSIHTRMKKEVGEGIYIGGLPVRNRKNVLLYDISLITKNEGTFKAFQGIIKKFEKLNLDPEQIENGINILLGKSATLDAFS